MSKLSPPSAAPIAELRADENASAPGPAATDPAAEAATPELSLEGGDEDGEDTADLGSALVETSGSGDAIQGDPLFGLSEGEVLPEWELEEGGDPSDWDDEDELTWAVGTEFEFIDEDTGEGDWDGPVGDGLDEEEGRGGYSMARGHDAKSDGSDPQKT